MMNIDRIAPGERVLCAVSGGADSMYLLCRMLELGDANGFSVVCAHYNHRLRGAESDRDERFVRAFCEAHGVPCHVGSGDVAAVRGMGTEEAARTLRYAFLQRCAEENDCRWIATAHTANDNAETMLLNLARGCGLRGLGGIPPVRENVLRPMLDTTRAEVEQWLLAYEIPHVEDSSNASDDFARNRVRHAAVPALEDVNGAFVRHAAQTAALLREDETYLSELAAAFLAQHAPERGLPTAALLALARPVRSRVFRTLTGAGLSQAHVEALHALCAGTERAALDLPGMRVTREQGRLWFGEAAETPRTDRALNLGETAVLPEQELIVSVSLPETAFEIHNTLTTFYFKSTSIRGKLTLTSRKSGDRIRLAGRNCTKLLSDLFTERKLTQRERDAALVIRDETGPIAVSGFGVAERCAAQPGDTVIRVSLQRMHEKWGE